MLNPLTEVGLEGLRTLGIDIWILVPAAMRSVLVRFTKMELGGANWHDLLPMPRLPTATLQEDRVGIDAVMLTWAGKSIAMVGVWLRGCLVVMSKV